MSDEVPIRDRTSIKLQILVGGGVLLYFIFLMVIAVASRASLEQLKADVAHLTADNAITLQLLQRALNITAIPG